MKSSPKRGSRKFKSLECQTQISKQNTVLSITTTTFDVISSSHSSHLQCCAPVPLGRGRGKGGECNGSPPIVRRFDLVNANYPVRCCKRLFQVFKFDILITNFNPPCTIIPRRFAIFCYQLSKSII